LPFREPALPFRDIIEAIISIEQFTAGMDLKAFRSDPKTVSAVERKMLLISEAAVRLGDEGERLVQGSHGATSGVSETGSGISTTG
jgi:uncharacterized protein with HEPN domain